MSEILNLHHTLIRSEQPFHYETRFTTSGLLYLVAGKVAIFQSLVIARPTARCIICWASSSRSRM